MKDKVALGFFTYVDDTCDALHELDEAGYNKVVTFSPVPSHDIEHVLDKIRPKFHWNWENIKRVARERDFHIARFSLLGAFMGFTVAMSLLVGTALLWPVNQGGFPVVALPTVGLLTYELITIHGIVITVAGFFVLGKLPAFRRDDIGDEAFNDDKFGIALKYENQQQYDKISKIMMDCGADKVEPREGRLRT